LSFEDRLSLLVDLECNRRLDSRTQRRLKQAEFPMQATVEDLDFSPDRGLERSLVLETRSVQLVVDKALNILIGGATGTGKSYLACSLGVAACRMGYSVRYLRTARFLLTLNHARQEDSYLNLLRSLSRTDVLIRMIGCVILFNCLRLKICWKCSMNRFGKSATIIVSQVPVSDWHAASQTQLWRMPSWIVRFTMLID
jgi:hypothetical protein